MGEFDVDRLFAAVEQAGLPPAVDARRAVAVVLAVLSRRLSGGEASALFHSLPPRLRALVKPCLPPRGERPERFLRRGFHRRVAAGLEISLADAERVTATVLAAVRPRLSASVLATLREQLPKELRTLIDPAAPGGVVATTAERLFWEELDRRLPDRSTEHRRAIVRAVLQTLSRRLSAVEAEHLHSALPPELKALAFGGPTNLPRPDDFGTFIDQIASATGTTDRWAAMRMTAAVLGALRRILPADELGDLERELPGGLRELL